MNFHFQNCLAKMPRNKIFFRLSAMKFFVGILIFGLKIFLFWSAIFFLLRLNFIFFLREFLGEVSAQEIFIALIFGTRLSFQTAGISTVAATFCRANLKFCDLQSCCKNF